MEKTIVPEWIFLWYWFV